MSAARWGKSLMAGQDWRLAFCLFCFVFPDVPSRWGSQPNRIQDFCCILPILAILMMEPLFLCPQSPYIVAENPKYTICLWNLDCHVFSINQCNTLYQEYTISLHCNCLRTSFQTSVEYEHWKNKWFWSSIPHKTQVLLWINPKFINLSCVLNLFQHASHRMNAYLERFGGAPDNFIPSNSKSRLF